jgi:hypothetical protein
MNEKENENNICERCDNISDELNNGLCEVCFREEMEGKE